MKTEKQQYLEQIAAAFQLETLRHVAILEGLNLGKMPRDWADYLYEGWAKGYIILLWNS